MIDYFKTIKQTELEITPLKCKNGNQCFCDGSCKKSQQGLANSKVMPENPYSNIIITFLKKASLVSQIKELVKNTPNDFELGEAVRKLFS